MTIVTKHKYYIQTKEGKISLIIDEGQLLPTEVKYRIFTEIDNQKVISVNIFSDAENGSKEKIGTGFFTISENLPAHSELQFTFRLTEDETMNVCVRVASTGKIHNVTICRGDLNTLCFETIQQSFDNVMGDPDISEGQKYNFLNDLQKIIEGINIKIISSEDSEWINIEEKVKTITKIALFSKECTNKINNNDSHELSLDELFEISIN